jgi:hypothetical protein
MGLGVSRDGTRVIALGLMTRCLAKGSLIILLERIHEAIYTT